MASRKPQQRNPKQRKGSETTGTLRVIGGQWRSRRLSFSAVEGLRPTTDRVRETLFNWVAPVITGARCLDLFTGSGALGLEALSREAGSVTFIDQSSIATRSLKQNLQLLNATNATVINTDAVKWLKTETPESPFNIVFIDPPFRCGLVYECVEQLQSRPLLTSGAYIYIEIEKEAMRPNVPPNWQLHREKEAGQVRYMLFISD
ncbi:16S rRNA (guanine(966)-N(2))-methyltransferase RsmD [Alkalimarinus sediminis]|uniref:Ribosomal RNA small subunit methyltransferase D n=1 Tax=Alkalimarinus sediminis TaxID=1632866 RepID=A0A9E8HH44_9ALTE|nr:16S rRNA (guanine(966)-N(2))-methyltransferase RsmD [Alkalimarinus sediminis]UZW74565.1 16S rRNA (guanine(966)-N(2))-methyltransferase RsmD [Alkalimarinus sediminis]